uniref:hypothetical protein n=1 Tax=Wolbachia endosymbiont (group A) of Scambus nigricans TaxID=2954055 RepID=UPI00223257E6|nr:hypothetical protein [Wolbachia endosymbiont (group A) of Scambus nigricans]
MIIDVSVIALFTIIRTDRNMLLACYSHKHISYRIRTIIRKAIPVGFGFFVFLLFLQVGFYEIIFVSSNQYYHY